MTFTITLNWWLWLPLVASLVLLCGGLWADRVWQELEGTIIAAFLCLVSWLAILYGRYEPWFVFPVMTTIWLAWSARGDGFDQEGRRFVACVVIVAWALVLYGRLTA